MKVNIIGPKRVLEANEVYAKKNRELIKTSGVFAVNIISSPGSGKTTLLEKTTKKLKSSVIVGDLQTTRDAERIAPNAVSVTQINTGSGCHLFASQITDSLKEINLSNIDFLFIENVGNLVCPSEFDLGENKRIVLLSVPEGDDKVAKYPTVFRVADLLLITKTDLLSVLDFNIERIKSDLKNLNENIQIISISSVSGEGLGEWYSWLNNMKSKM